MKKVLIDPLNEIKDVFYEDCEELLSQDLLLENSFQEMYGEDVDSILSSDLFQDTNYTTFEEKNIRLLFLLLYLKKVQKTGEYIVFSEFVDKREQSQIYQKHINDSKITLALELPDVIQGNKLLRSSL